MGQFKRETKKRCYYNWNGTAAIAGLVSFPLLSLLVCLVYAHPHLRLGHLILLYIAIASCSWCSNILRIARHGTAQGQSVHSMAIAHSLVSCVSITGLQGYWSVLLHFCRLEV